MNIRVTAKNQAIYDHGLSWGLGIHEAEVKFNAQPQKWQKKQVNHHLKLIKLKEQRRAANVKAKK